MQWDIPIPYRDIRMVSISQLVKEPSLAKLHDPVILSSFVLMILERLLDIFQFTYLSFAYRYGVIKKLSIPLIITIFYQYIIKSYGAIAY